MVDDKPLGKNMVLDKIQNIRMTVDYVEKALNLSGMNSTVRFSQHLIFAVFIGKERKKRNLEQVDNQECRSENRKFIY